MTQEPFTREQLQEKLQGSNLQKFHVIFNPVSGPGEPDQKQAEIESALASIANLTMQITKPDDDIAELARQAVADGADVVIAAGGDGTVSAVAGVLVDIDIALGVIPTGTANGVATALGIPENYTEAGNIIKAGHRPKVDTARCNGNLMLLAIAIGFEAKMINRMDREEKKQLGKFAIVLNSLRELREVEHFDTQLQTPEESWHESATAVTIANMATVDMVLAQGPSKVEADDGALSITMAAPKRRWGVVASAADLFLSALQNRSVEGEQVHSCKAREVTVETDPPQRVYIDGEPCGKTPITVTCYPSSLTVLVPPENAPQDEPKEEPEGDRPGILLG
jgi:YegS/Rv2252/BmrU family lipid kinase